MPLYLDPRRAGIIYSPPASPAESYSDPDMDDVPDEPDLISSSEDEVDSEDEHESENENETDNATPKLKPVTDTKAAGRYFQSDDFSQAEALYSKAINADPQSPLLYTNRAMARLKLSLHEGVIEDCAASLKLLPHNMKAHYYRAQALLALGRAQEALEAAKKAYQLAYLSGDRGWERSLGNIVALILKIKKVAWEEKEERRLKENNKLRDQVIAALRKEMEEQLDGAKADQAEEELKKEYEEKIEEVKRVWQKAAEGDEKKREVPDWMIDDITFAIMVDPVIVGFLSLTDISHYPMERLYLHYTDKDGQFL
jgi:STIP1 family protein 1